MRGVFRNLRRAGVAKNRSRTSTRLPAARAAGVTGPTRPPSTVIALACSASAGRLVMVSRATAPMDGSASPRKPREVMCTRSSSGSLEVAWRSTDRASSCGLMPQPSSVTPIRLWPPSRITTSMWAAPASSAFSTSSLTALAGRSTTSPAAMRLTVVSDSRRMAGRSGGLGAEAGSAVMAPQ